MKRLSSSIQKTTFTLSRSEPPPPKQGLPSHPKVSSWFSVVIVAPNTLIPKTHEITHIIRIGQNEDR